MTAEMLQVLLLIFAHVVKRGPEDLEETDNENLIVQLQAAGFSREQISDAFIWLRDTIHKEVIINQKKIYEQPKGMRLYHPFEMQKLTIESRGLLLSLEESGFITPEMREELIEKACLLEIEQVKPEHLHWLILSVIYNNKGHSRALLWLYDYQAREKTKPH